MFLMWIVPLLLIGLFVYAATGNNLVNAFKPASRRACQPVVKQRKMTGKSARTADKPYERNSN